MDFGDYKAEEFAKSNPWIFLAFLGIVVLVYMILWIVELYK